MKIAQKGFTLIELIVVIAILGVLSVVLFTTIDPLDKINTANDSGVVQSIAQFGKANDAYAASKNNMFPGGATVNAALTVLQAAGESKVTSYTPPPGYTVIYLDSPDACTSGTTCTGYSFQVTDLKSKKYTATPAYQVINGKGCLVAAASVITQAQLDALAGASSGAGACP